MKSYCRDCCFPEIINSKACGGCEGTELITTPQSTANRPGLPQLACRIGTHADFLETMKARLSSIEFPELDGLSTREGNDPSIALLDAWATVADVLSFYQERIANEGYLRTARERRSILELGRLVGYALRPGVSSSVFLGYTIEDSTKEEVIIPAGSRVQSVPGPDELPQTFETSEDLKARAEWNNLRPRMSQPQTKTTIRNKDEKGNPLDSITGPRVYLKGINTNLKPNDRLLIDFDAENTKVKPELFRVTEVRPDAKAERTLVMLARPDYALLMVLQYNDGGKNKSYTFIVPFPAEDIPVLQVGTGKEDDTSTISITLYSDNSSSTHEFSINEVIPFSAPNRPKVTFNVKTGSSIISTPEPENLLAIDFYTDSKTVTSELFRIAKVTPPANNSRTLVMLARYDYSLLIELPGKDTLVIPFSSEGIPDLQAGGENEGDASTLLMTFYHIDNPLKPQQVGFNVTKVIPSSAPNRPKVTLQPQGQGSQLIQELKDDSLVAIDFYAGSHTITSELYRISKVTPGAAADSPGLVILTRPDSLVISLPKIESTSAPSRGDILLIDFDAQGDVYQPKRYLVTKEPDKQNGSIIVRLQPEDPSSSIPSIQLNHPISITFGTQEDAAIKVYTATKRKAEYLNDRNVVVFVLNVAASAASSSTGRLSIMRTPTIRSADIREVESFRGSLFQPILLGSMKNLLSIKKEPEKLISPKASFSIEIASKVIAGHSESKKIAAIIDAEAESPRIVKAYALRTKASIFGHNVAREPQYEPKRIDNPAPPDKTILNPKAGNLKPQSEWPEWKPDSSEAADLLYLDRVYDQILKGTYVAVVDELEGDKVFEIKNCYSISRNAYGISSESLKMEIEPSGWWNPVQGADNTISKLRSTKVFAQQVELPLAEEPIKKNISGKLIELDGFYDGLRADQLVIISGELEEISGIPFSDLYRLNLIEQRGNPDIPGDKTHTFIQLNRELTTAFKRDTVKIYGNVVKATHGETRQEVLGSGDSSKALQSFALKQKPLTYVSAANPSGVESTLKVFVNDVRWHEAETLADREPTDRNFITKTNNQDITNVQFGNGKKGMRLPTGLENIKAVYRSGMGKQGNVRSGQLSLLLDKPLGVKEVINPLRASGGVDREGCDQGRKNVPIAVKALDRLVSVQDYEDFSRTYTGIGKARAVELTDGRRQLVHVTIAGTDNIPIDEYSDLFLNLHRALHKFGDPHQPIHLAVRELMLMVISAEVRILPDYQWKPVEAQLRKTMLETFSFERRELGQDVLLSEVFRAMQSVPGVEYVDVNTFGGIPEKIRGDSQGDERRPLLPDEIAEAVSWLSRQRPLSEGSTEKRLLTSDEIAEAVWCKSQGSESDGAPGECNLYKKNEETKKVRQRIEVNLAAFDNHMLRPAQLAFLTPDVPETLILNQI